MTEQLDVQQADIVEGQPSSTNWKTASGWLPHWFLGNPDMWMVPRNAEKEQKTQVIKQRSLTLVKAPASPLCPLMRKVSVGKLCESFKGSELFPR